MPTTPEMQRRVAQLVETFQIDHGIAMPPGHRRGLSTKVFASLLKMQPPNGDGLPRDSIMVPCDSHQKKVYQSASSSIGHAIRKCRLQHPTWEFSFRKMEGGIRCWRTR